MKRENKGTEDLDRILDERGLSGLWSLNPEDRPLHPKTTVKPNIWKWADVYDGLCQAWNQIGISKGSVERRTIRLVNPGMKETEMTSHTMLLSFQLLHPGEIAPAHRHTMAALRFILQGEGAYTVVEGEKMPMHEGDLILTPQWTWHDHGHEGGEPVVWIDGLDVPLIQSLQVISFEPYPENKQPSHISKQRSAHFGMTRPVTSSGRLPAPLHYHWQDTYSSLKALAETEAHPYEGIALEYINPLTGGPTLPTMSCWIQMLRPGERTQVHRHTSTSIYHAFRGSGTTVINGEPFHWDKGDTFIVPLWNWHEHANRSSKDEAILFSMNDAPVLNAFGLYREEGQGESRVGL